MTHSIPDLVTCPECGATQEVQTNRRDSADFCRACDFPLFWAPSQVQRERDAAGADQTLRRLPGTAGRATLASATCPHCRELNVVTAEVCVRCGRSMHPVIEPPTQPIYVPPPPPPVVEEAPPEHSYWWLWALLAFVLILGTVLGILSATGTLG